MTPLMLSWCSHSNGKLGETYRRQTRGCWHNIITKTQTKLQWCLRASLHKRVPTWRHACVSESMQASADLCCDPAAGCTVHNVILAPKHKGHHVWGCVCVCLPGHMLTQTAAMKMLTCRDFRAIKTKRGWSIKASLSWHDMYGMRILTTTTCYPLNNLTVLRICRQHHIDLKWYKLSTLWQSGFTLMTLL